MKYQDTKYAQTMMNITATKLGEKFAEVCARNPRIEPYADDDELCGSDSAAIRRAVPFPTEHEIAEAEMVFRTAFNTRLIILRAIAA